MGPHDLFGVFGGRESEGEGLMPRRKALFAVSSRYNMPRDRKLLTCGLFILVGHDACEDSGLTSLARKEEKALRPAIA